jgi:hypothetical protein
MAHQALDQDMHSEEAELDQGDDFNLLDSDLYGSEDSMSEEGEVEMLEEGSEDIEEAEDEQVPLEALFDEADRQGVDMDDRSDGDAVDVAQESDDFFGLGEAELPLVPADDFRPVERCVRCGAARHRGRDCPNCNAPGGGDGNPQSASEGDDPDSYDDEIDHDFEDDDDDGALDNGFDYEDAPDEGRYPDGPPHDHMEDERSETEFSFEQVQESDSNSESSEGHHHEFLNARALQDGQVESHLAFLTAQMPFVNTLWHKGDELVRRGRYGSAATQILWSMRLRDPWLDDGYDIAASLQEVRRQMATADGFGDKPRVAVVYQL